jgi:hypothetical protein
MPFAALVIAAAAPHFVATYTKHPPKIDGVLDDIAWKESRVTGAFTQKFPAEATPPGEKTTLRIVYDDEAIYVSFDCEQVKTPIVRRLTRRDRIVEADWVSIGLDTKGDGKSAFEFTVNAAGVLADALRFDDTNISTDWDEIWDARTTVHEKGWTAEMKIPLRVLRFSSAHEQSWGLQAPARDRRVVVYPARRGRQPICPRVRAEVPVI